jgi:hypothetical protein
MCQASAFESAANRPSEALLLGFATEDVRISDGILVQGATWDTGTPIRATGLRSVHLCVTRNIKWDALCDNFRHLYSTIAAWSHHHPMLTAAPFLGLGARPFLSSPPFLFVACLFNRHMVLQSTHSMFPFVQCLTYLYPNSVPPIGFRFRGLEMVLYAVEAPLSIFPQPVAVLVNF